MIDSVITALEALTNGQGGKLFDTVGDTLDASAITEQNHRGTAAFIVELAEQAGANQRQTGPALQSVTENIGVLLVLSTRNDRKGSKARGRLSTLRTATRSALVGKLFTDEYTKLTLISGELMEMSAGVVIWLDTYQTTRLLEEQ